MARTRDLARENIQLSVAPGVVVQEFGNKHNHTSILTLDTTLGAIAGGAALGLGKLLGNFPAGAIRVSSTSMSVSLKQTQGNITADTPDIGIGTTVASGVVSVLGGTAGFENILTGQTAADCDGTATVKTVDTSLVIEAADSHSIYLNVADTWAASGDAATIVKGVIQINWQYCARV